MSEEKIIDCWLENAPHWIRAVRQGEIKSREAITNQAIVDAITHYQPESVIDIGCGEGWLARRLSALGIQTLGIDASAALISAARQSGGGQFELLSYADLAPGRLPEKFNIAVCNFSLLGKDSVDEVFANVKHLLKPSGLLIVQTLHPRMVSDRHNYCDGWRPGSWDGFGSAFSKPAPWYFRTIESWQQLYSRNGYKIPEIREPIHPDTQKPASIIFIGQLPHSPGR